MSVLMIKIILIFIILTILITALFLWWKKPQVITSILPSNILGHTTSPQDQSKDNKPTDLLNQTADKLKQGSKDTLSSLKETVYNSAQTVLDKTFDKKNTDEGVNVNISTPTNLYAVGKNTHLINLTQDDVIKIKLLKNTGYKLQFKNVPSNFCIYIGDSKFEIDESKIVEVQFQKNGNYSIKVNSCDLKYRVIGEITVE